MYSSPRCVVSNGYLRVNYQALLLRRRAVIDDMVPENQRVGNCNLFVLYSADSRYQDTLAQDIADSICYLDTVPILEGSHISQDYTRYDIGDRGSGAQREQDTEEYG